MKRDTNLELIYENEVLTNKQEEPWSGRIDLEDQPFYFQWMFDKNRTEVYGSLNSNETHQIVNDLAGWWRTKDPEEAAKLALDLYNFKNKNLTKESHQTNTVKLKVIKNEIGEYVVKVYINGKYDDMKSYFTDDKEDAITTKKSMSKQFSDKGYQVIDGNK